jgi:transcription elongation factor GreA
VARSAAPGGARVAAGHDQWMAAGCDGEGHDGLDAMAAAPHRATVHLADPTLCARVRTSMKERILKRFDEDISALERELKTELPKEIQRAREFGDLRENAEYQAAKERQTYVQARIAMLTRRRNEVALMNLDRVPHDKAGFGSTVTLKEPSGTQIVYQLVMPEDADAEKGLISTASPIGRALLNKEAGDDVAVTTPAGARKFEIVKLVTIHDE